MSSINSRGIACRGVSCHGIKCHGIECRATVVEGPSRGAFLLVTQVYVQCMYKIHLGAAEYVDQHKKGSWNSRIAKHIPDPGCLHEVVTSWLSCGWAREDSQTSISHVS